MTLSTQPYKGARDFYPEDKRLQKFIFNKWREVCEKFGYEEYDAPVLEPLELYLAKTSDEIVNEQTFAFEDRGGRKVTIRPEMTPSVSRMVAARRQELVLPLRLYSIPNLWRYERPQRGRLREHWQLNADLFGVNDLSGDQEIIELADALVQAFKAKRESYIFRINSRALMDAITKDFLKLDSVQSATLIRLIDRREKIERSEFIGSLEAIFSPSQRESGLPAKLEALLEAKSLKDLPAEVVKHPAALQLASLLLALREVGITNVKYDPTLMRGFDYYTDIVFEVFDTHPENNRSMFGGGRYDGLVAQFGVEALPTVGFGMGDITFQNFLEINNLLPELKTETEVYLIPIGLVLTQANKVAADLRSEGLNVAVDITGRKIDKQLKTAIKKNIPYVIFVGEKELASEQYKLKKLDTSVEESHSLQRIVSIVKDHRQKDS